MSGNTSKLNVLAQSAFYYLQYKDNAKENTVSYDTNIYMHICILFHELKRECIETPSSDNSTLGCLSDFNSGR
ncbi:unnamed protein product [Trichobilharzia regenti]|nr:unnamed protein product [Trichobilharzia regenti]